MSNFERDVGAKVGAEFLQGPDGVLFQFVVDPATVIGPRAARSADQEAHPAAWAAFMAANGLDPLDLDASGAPGGSLPDAERPKRGRPRKVNDEPAIHHPDGG